MSERFGVTGVVALAVLTMTVAGFARAQQPAEQSPETVQQQLDQLKQGQEAILKELQELRKLVTPRPAEQPLNPRTILLDLGDRPAQGAASAPLTLIEVTDYQCPFCGRHHRETAPQIERDFVATGKLRHMTFDSPLENLHPLAFKAAEASRCAAEQGKYSEMQDRLFATPPALEPWDAHAKALGIDVERFNQCLASGQHAAAIRADLAQLQKAGINSTPTFLLARTEPGQPGKVRGVALVIGAKAYDAFKKEIEQALAAPPQ
jgi:protein-disulfide isomerase